MYHAACKVAFQLFNRSYSQLTCFNFLWKHKLLSSNPNQWIMESCCSRRAAIQQQSLLFEATRLPGVWVTYEHQTSHQVTWHQQQINTNGNMLSFAPDTTKLSGTAEKQHVRKSKCQPCSPYQVQSSTCICPYCIRAGEPHQQPCRVGDQQYEYVLL